MSDLVLDHQRRRDVADATGLSFSRVRAVRRVARAPMTMGELADALGIERPNATVVVDDLEARGLVRRTPPDALASLPAADLEALRRILGWAGAVR